jgi:hypothetical protein
VAPVTAIGVLLDPDRTMVERVSTAIQRLRGQFGGPGNGEPGGRR